MNKRMDKRIMALLTLVVLLVLVGCGESSTVIEKEPAQQAIQQRQIVITEPVTQAEQQTVPEEQQEVSPPQEVAPLKQKSTVKELTIEAFKYGFDPDTIEVNKEDKIRIIATTRDVGHGFGIKEYGINEGIVPGKETVIEFTADKTGTFTFYCTVYCGSGHKNMKGTLVVK